MGGGALNVLDLFSGIGGFSLGLERAGMRTVAFCEIDPHAQAVLRNHWRNIPVHDDVRTLTREWLAGRGVSAVDLICGGFPCQDASVANIDGKGAEGDRTGLYREIIRLADEFGCLTVMENVTNLLDRGFGDVLGALAKIGFDAEWECISARDVGADHERDRLWIVAYPGSERRQGFEPYHGVLGRAKAALAQHGDAAFGEWRSLVGGQRVLRSVDGLSVAMERRRLHGLGNAVTPVIPEIIGRAILEAEGVKP